MYSFTFKGIWIPLIMVNKSKGFIVTSNSLHYSNSVIELTMEMKEIIKAEIILFIL